MFEYGLSVSLNTTPRTSTPSENMVSESNGFGVDFDFDTLCWAPLKRSVVVRSGEDSEEESISPRVLFREEEIPPIARRLDFEDDPVVSFELSPPSPSSFSTVVADRIETIGDCGVCYSSLPLRANHIFTVCGHLFCVRCLLKWWDTNTTCPFCRAEIFVDDAHIPPSVSDNPIDDDVEEEEEEEDNEEIWVRRDIHRAVVAVDNDRTTDESDDDDDDNPRQNEPITRMNQYLYQDAEWNWSLFSPLSDDILIPHLTPGEIYGIRENREIATNLFARSRFRDTLLQSSSLFMGRVWNGMFVHKHNWTNIMLNEQFQEQRNGVWPAMFEFVIRRESAISPVYEINIFGFMKDVVIIAVDRADGEGMYDDNRWENNCEYAFVAEVFTPTDFYIGDSGGGGGGSSNMVQSYGSYDITEGIINTHKLVIPFLQIRRLYRLTSHEQLDI